MSVSLKEPFISNRYLAVLAYVHSCMEVLSPLPPFQTYPFTLLKHDGRMYYPTPPLKVKTSWYAIFYNPGSVEIKITSFRYHHQDMVICLGS